MEMRNRSKSRRRTPWDGLEKRTETQEYLQMHYTARYEERHPRLADAGEAAMINFYEPAVCPYCQSEKFIQKGYDAIGVKRYRCSCGKYFKPTTGTIFDSRKIPICEWIEYCLNIFRYVSLNADSWSRVGKRRLTAFPQQVCADLSQNRTYPSRSITARHPCSVAEITW